MSQPLTICIVTADITGPIRNGGIGSAYYNLAHALARAGHRVTVLYALGAYCEQRTIADWQREYGRFGIEFVPVPPTNIQGHHAMKTSYAVYRWLKDKRFDVVHCHEWRGIGFCTAIAKQQGLCLDGAVLCVGAHSPGLWHHEGMNELADAEALEIDFMERETVAHADVLWTPSAHMLRWMQREGWRLPRTILRRQYIMLDAEPARAVTAEPRSELVFFGRLETRKGLDLFCDALDRLAARRLTPPHVTFLGKVATVGGVPSETYIKTRAARWPFTWSIVSNLDRQQAMRYLQQPNRIAVIPSRLDNLPYTVLECLAGRVPFVASNIGGIPEMVRARDRGRVLFALTAESMAERLAAVVEHGLKPAAMRISAARTIAEWLEWHEAIVRNPPATCAPAIAPAEPLVSVCVTHRNRPAFLRAALDSIHAQDYRRFEVILVDDGSDAPEALVYLDALQPLFDANGANGWRLLRQPHRYPGAARNAAIAAARGEYVLFMDDDNLARPDELRTFVGAAVRTGADVLTCFLDVFHSTKPNPSAASSHTWGFLGGAIVPGLLRNVFGDTNALFRRTVFERIGGFSEDFGIGCEDWELLARVVLAGLSLEVVPEPLVRYRQATTGVQHTTPPHANYMRALRPYFRLLPPHLRPLVHLSSHRDRPADAPAVAAPATPALDHVRQAVVFGSGEAGRRALGLASRCGWTVPWIVDNNPAMWDTTAHGLPVRGPDSITHTPVDLVIVASMAGKPSISAQLEKMGLEPGREFMHFLDPVKLGDMTLQLSLP